MIFVAVNFNRHIPIGNLIFTCPCQITNSVNYLRFNHPIKQLKNFTKNCRNISAIYFFNNEQIFFIWILVSVSQNGRKRTCRKFVGNFAVCNIRKNLTDKFGIRVIWVKYQPFDFGIFIAIFMSDSPTFT